MPGGVGRGSLPPAARHAPSNQGCRERTQRAALPHMGRVGGVKHQRGARRSTDAGRGEGG